MSKEDVYALDRHTGETDRLNAQNVVLNKMAGYIVNPAIEQRLPPNPKVADIGTGTGAWLVDVSKQFPSATALDGYDISDVAFLPTDKRPANVHLSVLDAKQPAPAHLHGTYDLVHLRFLNAAMQPDDWTKVSTHAFQLLKPGGALQWFEGDFSQLTSIFQSDANTKTEALERGSAQAVGPLGYNFAWMTTHLRQTLLSVGFGEASQKLMSADRLPEQRKEMSLIAIGATYALLRRQHALGQAGAWSEQEIENTLREMRQEAEDGAYHRADMHQFVAFKNA